MSLSDLVLIPAFKKAWEERNKGVINVILYNHGFDITQEIEEVECTHRNLRKQAVTGIRFEGLERLDRPWVKGPYASKEAKLYSNDASLRQELANMSKEGYNWDDYVERVKNKQYVEE